MRRDRGTNVFAAIGKAIFESNVGRIRWRSNMWTVVGSQWDKRRIQNTALIGKSSVNERGEFIADEGKRTLVRKPCVLCPCAPTPQADFYLDGKQRWWVPAVACKKCEHHRPSTRGMRFPRCTFKGKDVVQAAVNSIVQFDSAIARAQELAKAMSGAIHEIKGGAQ